MKKGKAEFYDYMTGLSFGAAVDENGRVSEIRPEEPLQQDPSPQPDPNRNMGIGCICAVPARFPAP